MKWIKASELPKENGLYVCQTIKVKNGEKSNAVTYGEFRIGYKSIKVDDEMYGEVVEWLDESAPVDDVVDAIGNLEIQGEDESMIKLREIGTLVDDIMNCIPDRQPEIDALQKRVEELEGKYESDKDNDYEETLPEFCSNCGAEYDEIDYEYQICHLCGCGQTTTEKTNNH